MATDAQHDWLLLGNGQRPRGSYAQSGEETGSGLAASSPVSRASRRSHRGRLVRRYLLLADAFAVFVALLGVELYVIGPTVGGEVTDRLHFYLGAAVITFAMLAVEGLYGRDEFRADHVTADDLPDIAHAVGLSALVVLMLYEALDDAYGLAVVVGALPALIYLPASRAAARFIARRNDAYVQNTLIIGAGHIGQLMGRKLLTHPEYRLRVLGFVDADPRELADDVADIPVVGGPDDIPRLVSELDIERVIVAFSNESHVDELQTIRLLKELDLQIDIVPRLFEVAGPNADINVFEGLSVLALPPMRLSRANLIAKRTLDIVISLAALVVTAPLVVLIALAIKLDSRGPLLYRGTRVGPRGRRFSQLKFRSMDPRFATQEGHLEFQQTLQRSPAMEAEFNATQKLADDPRVTRVGRFLRRTSLDELPQILNVLRGDLSLVGPRPITESELHERYTPRVIAQRDSESLVVGYWDSPGLRPGLTGYWQISGRSTMSFEERIRLDTAYLTSWSLKLDLSILTKTARVLLAGRGAY